ncbi:MAG: type II toxin-antitoxin system Phd/YefM family antitoxin [Acidobacteriota bacterium]|mgnify:CR=1 FL=1|jgi:prevent-host-death family protein
MKTMKVSEFKARCLDVLKQLEADGTELVITRNGRPVCRVIPYRTSADTLFGALAGSVEVQGDILAPLEEVWEEGQ